MIGGTQITHVLFDVDGTLMASRAVLGATGGEA
jgi:hypothetical protein